MHAAILSLVDSLDWRDTARLTRDEKDLYRSTEQLGEEGSRFSLRFTFDGDGLFDNTVRGLAAFESRLRLAAILACAPRGLIGGAERISDLLRIRFLPVSIAALRMNSPIKVTIEGDLKEVERILNVIAERNQIEPTHRNPPSLLRRFIKSVMVLFGAAGLVLTPPFQGDRDIAPSVQAGVQDIVDEACGLAPEGAEITIKSSHIEIKVPCGTAEQRTARHSNKK